MSTELEKNQKTQQELHEESENKEDHVVTGLRKAADDDDEHIACYNKEVVEITDINDSIEKILECANDGETFDIYQIAAFRWIHRDFENASTFNSFYGIMIKATVCILIQIPSIIYITYKQIKDGLESKDWCNYDVLDFDNLALKYFAFLFTLFLGMKFIGLMQVNGYNGMYSFYPVAIPQNIVSSWWLFIGNYVNMFASLIAVWCAQFIIFFSESGFDLVLNSVAIFFILEIDDYMVDEEDYRNVLDKVTEIYFKKNNDGEFELSDKDKYGNTINKEGPKLELSECEKNCRSFWRYVIIGFGYITGVFGIIVPIVVAVCF